MHDIRKSKRGQVLLEYAIMLVTLLGVIVMLAFFVYVFKSHGGRVLDLISSEYP